MSPEQARRTKEIDFRADLWSLAVITFQCMTGELPFLSEGLGDLLAKIMFEPLPVPSSIVPGLPAEFDAWWARASSRDIEARFQSAKELADELAMALGITGAATVAAAPPGFREAALKRGPTPARQRRHPTTKPDRGGSATNPKRDKPPATRPRPPSRTRKRRPPPPDPRTSISESKAAENLACAKHRGRLYFFR